MCVTSIWRSCASLINRTSCLYKSFYIGTNSITWWLRFLFLFSKPIFQIIRFDLGRPGPDTCRRKLATCTHIYTHAVRSWRHVIISTHMSLEVGGMYSYIHMSLEAGDMYLYTHMSLAAGDMYSYIHTLH